MRFVLMLWVLAGCEKAGEPPPIEVPPAPRIETPAPPPIEGVRRALFSSDVATDALPLSIAIETIGGVSSVLIPRGTRLPTSITETFSTATDNQTSVEIHVLQGERPLARDNRTLGKFQLTGIPPAARAVPQIQVTFAIDAKGALSVSARDLATDANRAIRIEGTLPGPLDKAAVDRALQDAAAARAEGDRHRRWSEARIQLDSLVYSTRKLLADTGAKLSPSSRRAVEQALTRAEMVHAASATPGDPMPVLTETQLLQKAVFAMTEELYRTAK